MSRDDIKPRVVIYGTGQYGYRIARLVLDKGWTITAAFNRAGAKVGQDIGRLAGLDQAIGVDVQDCDTADFSSLKADIGVVVLTNNLSDNMTAYERLMGAGLNVLCHGCQSYYPWGNDRGLADEIDAMAKANGVTFTGSGIWDMSRIWAGILLAGPCTEIKSLFHKSITDMKGQSTKEQAFAWGIGLTPDQYEEKGFNQNKLFRAYKTVPEHVLAALGYSVTDTRVRVEPVLSDEHFDSTDYLGTIIPPGHALGCRVVGEIETAEGVTGRVEMEGRLFHPHEVENMYWEVDGNPVTRIRTERDDSAHATAACLFNRIPQVIAAQPGIVLISQLGPLQHSALL